MTELLSTKSKAINFKYSLINRYEHPFKCKVIDVSLLSDIKFLIKKYIKNPIIIIAGAYLLYRFINSQTKKEYFCESIKVIDEENNVIYDENSKKFIMIKDNRVFSSDKKEDLLKMVGK